VEAPRGAVSAKITGFLSDIFALTHFSQNILPQLSGVEKCLDGEVLPAPHVREKVC